MDKLEQFKNIVELLDKDTVSQDEFVSMFGVLIDLVGQVQESNDLNRTELVQSIESALAKFNELTTVEWTQIKKRVEVIKNGEDYILTESDKKEIASFINVPVVEKVIQHTETIKEIPIVKEVAFQDTPDELIGKVNKAEVKIKQSQVEGLAEIRSMAVANSMPITTTFINGKRAKNFQFNGATVTVIGDTAFITITGGSGGGQVNSVVAGTGISVDNTDPANPIVSATGSSTGYQVPTGTVNGSNKVFTYVTAPNAIVVDGISFRKVSSDGTVNWTGTTVITLSVSPNFDTYAVA